MHSSSPQIVLFSTTTTQIIIWLSAVTEGETQRSSDLSSVSCAVKYQLISEINAVKKEISDLCNEIEMWNQKKWAKLCVRLFIHIKIEKSIVVLFI